MSFHHYIPPKTGNHVAAPGKIHTIRICGNHLLTWLTNNQWTVTSCLVITSLAVCAQIWNIILWLVNDNSSTWPMAVAKNFNRIHLEEEAFLQIPENESGDQCYNHSTHMTTHTSDAVKWMEVSPSTALKGIKVVIVLNNNNNNTTQ